MRIIELTTGLLLPLTNEEVDLLRKFDDNPIKKAHLNEREQYIANRLVERDVLMRQNENGKIIYYKRQRNS
jgi:hypothetical protein